MLQRLNNSRWTSEASSSPSSLHLQPTPEAMPPQQAAIVSQAATFSSQAAAVDSVSRYPSALDKNTILQQLNKPGLLAKPKYTYNQLNEAVAAVIAGEMSGNQAAKHFGIPQRTVARYVSRTRQQQQFQQHQEHQEEQQLTLNKVVRQVYDQCQQQHGQSQPQQQSPSLDNAELQQHYRNQRQVKQEQHINLDEADQEHLQQHEQHINLDEADQEHLQQQQHINLDEAEQQDDYHDLQQQYKQEVEAYLDNSSA